MIVQVIAQFKWQAQQWGRGLHLLLVKEGQPEVLDIKHFTHMQKIHKLLNVIHLLLVKEGHTFGGARH